MIDAPLPPIDVDEIDQLLDEGYSLPAEFYTDERIAELEELHIWERSWKPAGIVHELKEAGDYITTNVGTVPLVVVRGDDGELRAFVNVCRHRGHTVALGCGRCRSLQCRYHGWTYDLAGNLKGVPRHDERAFDLSEFGLVPAHVDTFGGVVWASVHPDRTLVEFLGDYPALGEKMGLIYPFELYDDWVRVEASDASTGNPQCHLEPFHFPSNWKVAVENGIECYHCTTIHSQSLARMYNLDAVRYEVHNFDRGTCQLTNFTDDWAARYGETRPPTPTIETADFKFAILFPNGAGSGVVGGGAGIMGTPDVSEMHLDTGTEPRGVNDSMFFEGINYRRESVPPREPTERQLEEAEVLRQTFEEDLAACALVQRNLRTGKVRYGRTMPESESSIRHFQRLWWEALKPACNGT